MAKTLDMVVHTCSPQEDYEFKTSLGYIAWLRKMLV